jgi:hypothetical protein
MLMIVYIWEAPELSVRALPSGEGYDEGHEPFRKISSKKSFMACQERWSAFSL